MNFRLPRAFLGICALTVSLAAASIADKGVLRILREGKQIGTERFEIESVGEGYRAHGEIRLKMPNGQEANETATLSLNKDLLVTTYSRVQKSPKKATIQVQFSNGQANAHYVTPEGASDYEYFLEPAMVVLDTNFFHHYFLLLQRFVPGKGEAQNVNVFVPQEAAPGMVLLEYLGRDEGKNKWLVKTEIEIFVWSDDNQHLLKLAVPSAQVEIVREEGKGSPDAQKAPKKN